ncbi:hypothetical protein MMC17_007723 [Xylographa soralifera]|nr:hypothetical protein [Xylographa soralifera]
MTASWYRLPLEIKRAIVKELPPLYLRWAQEVLKELAALAAEFTFQSIRLEAIHFLNCEQHKTDYILTFKKTFASDRLQKHVRLIIINTDCKYDGDSYLLDLVSARRTLLDEPCTFPEAFLDVLPVLTQFRRLTSILVKFPPDQMTNRFDDPNAWWLTLYSTLFRQTFLCKVFECIAAFDPSVTRLKSLFISHLREVNDPSLTENPAFLAVMNNLEVLKLNIVQESKHSEMNSETYGLDQFVFLEQLPLVWLQPAAQGLTALTLCQADYWGWCPKADFRDWLLKHGDTLEELHLDQCRILFVAEIPGPLDSLGFPTKEAMNDGDASLEDWEYSPRWSDYFARFGTGLSRLRIFQMGSSLWVPDEPDPFLFYTRRIECERQYLCRYLGFKMNTVPAWWEAEVEDLEEDGIEERDHQALAKLWRTVDARAGHRVRRPPWRFCCENCPYCRTGDYYPGTLTTEGTI